MYKKDLALNDLQLLICHKVKSNQTKPNQTKNVKYFFIKMTWFGIKWPEKCWYIEKPTNQPTNQLEKDVVKFYDPLSYKERNTHYSRWTSFIWSYVIFSKLDLRFG